MKVYHHIDAYQPNTEGTHIALGYFDGVHSGHRAVLSACADGGRGSTCAALTFRESPAKALGRIAPPELTDNEQKAELMAQLGIEAVIFADFAALKDFSAEDFIRSILIDKLKARHVYCGFNYRFGKGGAGDTALLKRICAENGVQVTVCEPVYLGAEQVSSTRIRALIEAGDMERAGEMLGRSYSIRGTIGGGNRIGRSLGFPTVNIPLSHDAVIPPYGVYASLIRVDGKAFRGVTNIGVHPTVGANTAPLCETFILDYAGAELYGAHAVCELMCFLRPEQKFASADELKQQIKADCERAARMIST